MAFPALRTLLLTLSIIVAFPPATLCADCKKIGGFSSLQPGDPLPDDWKPMTFDSIDRHTSYALVRDQGRTVLKAESVQAASGVIRPVRIDPRTYPWLVWSWKIKHVLEKGDLRSKDGDDYPARVYVAFAFDPDQAGIWARLRHKGASMAAGRELPGSALNYIWANKAPKGTIAPSPYARESMLVAVQSGNTGRGQWTTERRNLVQDYQRAFDRKPPEIIGLAVMTDSDDTGEQTTGYYGDIQLCREAGN